jgi:hypothetical protein
MTRRKIDIHIQRKKKEKDLKLLLTIMTRIDRMIISKLLMR